VTAEECARLQRRNLARFIRMLVGGAPDSKLLERSGVTGSVVPAAPARSIANCVIYHEAGQLRAALDDVAREYREAGVAAWLVWAPDGDDEASQLLEQAGHRRDSSPAAMAFELAGFEAPDPGDLDWDAQASAEEISRLNELGYGLPVGELARGLRDLKPGPTTHMYRARVDGETVSVGVVLDTGDEASVVVVATHPDFQGRGLSTRLLGQALAEARERGMVTSSLQASAAGEPIYRRLGYEAFGRMNMWERREA